MYRAERQLYQEVFGLDFEECGGSTASKQQPKEFKLFFSDGKTLIDSLKVNQLQKVRQTGAILKEMGHQKNPSKKLINYRVQLAEKVISEKENYGL